MTTPLIPGQTTLDEALTAFNTEHRPPTLDDLTEAIDHEIGDIVISADGLELVQTADGLIPVPSGPDGLTAHASRHGWGHATVVKVDADGNPYIRVLVGRERGEMANGRISEAVQVHVLWRWTGKEWKLQQPYMKRDIPWAAALGVYERKAGVAPTIHQPGVWGHVSHIMARELIGDRPVAGSVARTVAA